MTVSGLNGKSDFDRTNALMAGLVFLVTFVVYALTVQRSISFWDCGEFIACAATLGVPHPPGTPLMILIFRVFSMIPFVEDVSYRINYVSVISSSFTAMFGYLLAVRLIRLFANNELKDGLSRLITYVGGVAAGFFIAFSATNWANSVEAEAYGLAIGLSVAIFWLTLRYHEERETPGAWKTIVLITYLAVLGIGVHMTVFLVVPVCAMFFILNNKADSRDYLMICAFGVVELLLVFVFANGRGGPGLFKFVSVVLALVLFFTLRRKIRWGVLIAIAGTCSIMLTYSVYFIAVPSAMVAVVLLGQVGKRFGLQIQWKTPLVILLVGFIGFSVHFFAPIRSQLNPHLDMNNTSRSWTTFINFLDRRQYGRESMVDRMFQRRGEWSNQLGRHPNMGFWSSFERQYGGPGGWAFLPFFALGLLGAYVAIRKRLEYGLPLLVLLLVTSIGLVLYMNFADGTKYNFNTGDAYLEVRDRDYFFTPAFVFFGVVMGVGISAIMQTLRERLAGSGLQKPLTYAAGLLVFLPAIALSGNYFQCDRSNNYLPIQYGKNILDTCEPNALLFTGGDNDTYPVWCLQEAYGYRTDVSVVNLSLLNTDWYIEQMKNRFGVPMSLTDEQILWYPYEIPGVGWTDRPHQPFADRPRQRMTYLHPEFSGIATQDIMVDDIVIENKWQRPIYFVAPPYADSPLRLRDHATVCGQMYRLDREPPPGLIDIDRSYDLYMNTYKFDGFESPRVYRNEYATSAYTGLAMGALRLFDVLQRQQDTLRAEALMTHLITVMPEFWQGYIALADIHMASGDTASARDLYRVMHDTLTAFYRSDPTSQSYTQDLGAAKLEIGMLDNDVAMVEQGLSLIRKGFDMDRSSPLAYLKALTGFQMADRTGDIVQLTREHAAYGKNRLDSRVQAILGIPAPQTRGRR